MKVQVLADVHNEFSIFDPRRPEVSIEKHIRRPMLSTLCSWITFSISPAYEERYPGLATGQRPCADLGSPRSAAIPRGKRGQKCPAMSRRKAKSLT